MLRVVWLIPPRWYNVSNYHHQPRLVSGIFYRRISKWKTVQIVETPFTREHKMLSPERTSMLKVVLRIAEASSPTRKKLQWQVGAPMSWNWHSVVFSCSCSCEPNSCPDINILFVEVIGKFNRLFRHITHIIREWYLLRLLHLIERLQNNTPLNYGLNFCHGRCVILQTDTLEVLSVLFCFVVSW